MGKKITQNNQSLASLYFKNIGTEKLYSNYIQEFSSLTADKLKFYFLAARKGINYYKAILFDEIRRRDLRIGGLCQTRKLSVLGSDWEIKDQKSEINNQKSELVKFIEDNFSRINIEQLFSDIVETQLQGMSIFQLFYSIVGNKYLLNNISLIPNYLIYYKQKTERTDDDGINFIDFNKITMLDMRSQAISDKPNFPLIDVDPIYYFCVYSFDGNEENGLLNGLIDSVIWGYFFKSYGLKDWSVFLERFAIPAVIAEYDPLMSKVDRDALWNAVNNFGNLFRAIIPNTAKLTPISDNNKLSTGNLYENYLKYWNDELSIRILGQAMTTDTSEGGSYAKAQVGQIVRQDIQKGDQALITMAMNSLIKKLIDINFSQVSEYPKFVFKNNEDLDYKIKKADLILKLNQAGFVADEKELIDIFELNLKHIAESDNTITEFSEQKSKKNKIEEFLLELWSNLK